MPKTLKNQFKKVLHTIYSNKTSTAPKQTQYIACLDELNRYTGILCAMRIDFYRYTWYNIINIKERQTFHEVKKVYVVFIALQYRKCTF